jgi:hypothetical protein
MSTTRSRSLGDAPGSRQPPFGVGISVFRPYLPSYDFLLPFG